MHVLLECDFKESDTSLYILEITDIFLILFPSPPNILMEKIIKNFLLKTLTKKQY